MKTPPFLLAAALVFWGWQAEFILPALLMGLTVESARWTTARWEFSERDQFRVWDLCGVLFIGGLVIYYASDEIKTALAFLQWLPFLFFPMILAQVFAVQERFNLRAFSWFLRKRRDHVWSRKSINVSYPYFAVCMASASAANSESIGFYGGMSLLMCWALWSARPGRFSNTSVAVLLAVVVAAGFGGEIGLRALQPLVEAAVGGWFTQRMQRRASFRQSETAIGRIGRLKMSGAIVLRVETGPGRAPPELLREATFRHFNRTIWTGGPRGFGSVQGDTNFLWKLLPEGNTNRSVYISRYLSRGEGILAVPNGVSEIEHLPVGEVLTNSSGMVRVKDAPRFVRFQARYGPGATFDAGPGEDDLEISPREQMAVREIGRRLQLQSGRPEERIERIEKFFRDNFTYSTYISSQHVDPTERLSPLAIFLLRTRSGHCEYFASAAVLLLREADLPARYATGYSIQEKNGPGRYLVRERHAHSWALVYQNGVWRDFDATPPSWNAIESERASFFEPFSDLASRFWYEFSRWRYGDINYRRYLIWAIVPLLVFLAWRILFSKTRRRLRTAGPRAEIPWPGRDSEFYLIESELTKLGFGRNPSETLLHWIARIEQASAQLTAGIPGILVLHYRYRFDPTGLSADERARLRAGVSAWLLRTRTRDANS